MATKIPHYDQGDVWEPSATFTADPTALTVRIKDPSGTVTVITEATPAAPTLPIVRTGAGVFKHNGITLNDAGYWFVRFEGTGTAAAAHESQAIVDPSQFYEDAQLGTRALVGLAETKDWLQQQNLATTEDLELARVITDMSQRFTDESGGREFKVIGTNPQTRFFEPSSRYEVAVGDMASAPTLVRILASDWTTVVATVASTDFLTVPTTREAWEPITKLRFNKHRVAALRAGYRVEVTGAFGFPSVPGNVRQAVLEAVSAALDRDVEHYRTDLAPRAAEGGGTILQVTAQPMFLSLPPSSLAVARRYAAPLAA